MGKNYMPVKIAIYTVKHKDLSFSVSLLGGFLTMQKGIHVYEFTIPFYFCPKHKE